MNEATKLAGRGIITAAKKIKQATEEMQPLIDTLAQEGYLEQAGSLLGSVNDVVDNSTEILRLLHPIGSGEIRPKELEPDILAALKAIGKLDTLGGEDRQRAEAQIEKALLMGLMNAMSNTQDSHGNFIPLDQLPRL